MNSGRVHLSSVVVGVASLGLGRGQEARGTRVQDEQRRAVDLSCMRWVTVGVVTTFDVRKPAASFHVLALAPFMVAG